MTPSPRQWPKLLRQLRLAQQHIPLYRELWSRAGVDVRHFRTPEDFLRLPLVTRPQLLEAGERGRLDARFDIRRLRGLSTSGSAGEPLSLRFDRGSLRRRQWRFLKALWRSGYRPGHRVMLLSSRPSHAVQKVSAPARLAGWHYIDLYAGEAAMAEAFTRIKPHLLYGPLHALLLMAPALQRKGIPHRPRVLVSTSEQLTPTAERQLQQTFGTAVTDFYGLTECGLVAWRVAGASHYDGAHEDLFLELIPAPGADAPVQLAVTDLDGGSMPLYRYLTGDLVRHDARHDGFAVSGFAGKQVDALLLPDGRRVIAYLVDEALSQVDGLRRYRVEQQPDLRVHLAVDARDAAAAQAACAALAAVCEGRLEVELLPEIPAPSLLSHKARPIVSLAGRA